MPLCYLIFSPQPYDLTDEQVEEARALGHLLEVLGEKPADTLPAVTPAVSVPPPAPPASPPVPAAPAAKTKET